MIDNSPPVDSKPLGNRFLHSKGDKGRWGPVVLRRSSAVQTIPHGYGDSSYRRWIMLCANGCQRRQEGARLL